MRTARALVAAQLVLVALLVVLPRGSAWPVPGWLVGLAVLCGVGGVVVVAVAASELGSALTPMPLPRTRARLRTTGLYGLVRHPIYTGLVLAGSAVAAASGSVAHVVVLALLVALLSVKARWEERRLAARFPEYRAYAQRTPRFVPRLRG